MEVYRNKEKKKVEALIKNGWFKNDPGNGTFGGHKYTFVLQNSDNNFYEPILNKAKEYFNKNGIAWWKGSEPTGHSLSSQIACINHLFPIRKDKNAVLALLSSVSSNFVNPSRGTNCTSLDAFVYALHRNGSKWIIPIEWKYTEAYSPENKGSGAKGEIRHCRYDGLIQKSSQLIFDKMLNQTNIYYFEPFYQLMRQTLWAEQVVNNKTENIYADDYLHLHIVPYKNIDLLEKIYQCSKLNMPTTWRSCLVDQGKYKIISPENLFKNIEDKYTELVHYLKIRYWDD